MAFPHKPYFFEIMIRLDIHFSLSLWIVIAILIATVILIAIATAVIIALTIMTTTENSHSRFKQPLYSAKWLFILRDEYEPQVANQH